MHRQGISPKLDQGLAQMQVAPVSSDLNWVDASGEAEFLADAVQEGLSRLSSEAFVVSNTHPETGMMAQAEIAAKVSALLRQAAILLGATRADLEYEPEV